MLKVKLVFGDNDGGQDRSATMWVDEVHADPVLVHSGMDGSTALRMLRQAVQMCATAVQGGVTQTVGARGRDYERVFGGEVCE